MQLIFMTASVYAWLRFLTFYLLNLKGAKVPLKKEKKKKKKQPIEHLFTGVTHIQVFLVVKKNKGLASLIYLTYAITRIFFLFIIIII